MTTANPRRRRSFTLVEMLVVIAIIGVLAAILTPTLYRVVVKARQNVIAQELNQLHLAIESYKQKFGDYPPDFTSVRLVSDLTTANQLVVRHLRKGFPRHQENLVDVFTDGNNGLEKPNPAEALVFWLAQLREDPRQPLSASPSTFVSFFPFEETRLVYTRTIGDPNKPNAQQKLYVYVPPQGKDSPYVYFDSRIYTDDSNIPGVSPATPVASLSVYNDSSGNPVLYPYATKVNATAPLTMANRTTYQLISAGLDGEYGGTSADGSIPAIIAGDPTTYKVFPFGTNFRIGDMDNIANFSDGKIFEDHME